MKEHVFVFIIKPSVAKSDVSVNDRTVETRNPRDL